MNKKGIELSVNFIVMMILAIVVFGFGIKFAKDIFVKSNEMADLTYKDIDRQMQEISCATAERVCLPSQTKTIEGGKPAIFGMVIENVLDDGDNNFFIEVSPAEQNDAGKFDFLPKSGETRGIEIKPKEVYRTGIAVGNKGTAESGKTYAFVAKVKNREIDYVNPIVFYVKVP